MRCKPYCTLCLPSASSSASSISPPPPTTSPHPGYISWYSNWYKLVKEPKTWADAQKACAEQGGNLASVDMSYDQAFVAIVVQEAGEDVWIGLKRQVGSGGAASRQT